MDVLRATFTTIHHPLIEFSEFELDHKSQGLDEYFLIEEDEPFFRSLDEY
ncbi:MAG: hypothetical protein AAGC64_07010 [Bacteroidota bacterium]